MRQRSSQFSGWLGGCVDGAGKGKGHDSCNQALAQACAVCSLGSPLPSWKPNRRCWSSDSAQGCKKKKRILLVHPTKFLSPPLKAGFRASLAPEIP